MLCPIGRAIALGAVAIVTACSSATVSGPSSVAPSAAPAATIDCPAIDLRTPSGARLDLNGTWHAEDNAYYSFLEIGNCLWATGTNARAVITIRGTILNDFTVPIEFAVVACEPANMSCSRSHGRETLDLVFEEGSDGEIITLRAAAVAGDSGPPLTVTRWSRISETRPIFPPPTPGP